MRPLVFLALSAVTALTGATGASAASTNFGIRTLSMDNAPGTAPGEEPRPAARSNVDLRSAAGIGSQWGRVTSTLRSPARNRAVGGVRNSFHLSGRAIDIARRRGISHAQIAAAYRNAGYFLVESLDEGDHSHFAFGSAGAPRVLQASQARGELTRWRVVTVSSATLK